LPAAPVRIRRKSKLGSRPVWKAASSPPWKHFLPRLGMRTCKSVHSLLAPFQARRSSPRLALRSGRPRREEPAETLLELAPAHDAHLVMPRLGEPVEPSRAERVTPWWRAAA